MSVLPFGGFNEVVEGIASPAVGELYRLYREANNQENEFNSVKSTQEVGVYSEVCHALALAERDCWQKY